MNLENVLIEIQHSLKPVLLQYVRKIEESDLIPILEYCIQSKETYDRALFVRLGCEAVGGDWRTILAAMAGVEMMDFSVITIDDILDEAPRRMERSTVYNKWNKKIAIISAFILKSMATEALIDCCVQKNMEAKKLLRVIQLLEETHHKIYIGQYIDNKYETVKLDDVMEDMYLEMVKYTTGVQISSCSQLGGILGDGNEEKVQALKNYGLHTGTIFQIRDDLIDYIDDEHIIKKTPFLDLTGRKKRLPIMLAFKYFPTKVKKIINKSNLEDKDKDEIVKLINNEKVINSIKSIISSLGNKAMDSLRAIKKSNIKNIFEEIVELGKDI